MNRVIGANLNLEFKQMGMNVFASVLVNGQDVIEEIIFSGEPKTGLAELTESLKNKNLFAPISFTEDFLPWKSLLLLTLRDQFEGIKRVHQKKMCLCFGVSVDDIEKYKSETPDWKKSIKMDLLIGAGCGGCLKDFDGYLNQFQIDPMICRCIQVKESEIKSVMKEVGFDMPKITAATGAGGSCGSCIEDIKKIYFGMNPFRFKGKGRAEWMLVLDDSLKDFINSYPSDISELKLVKLEQNKVTVAGISEGIDEILYHLQDHFQKIDQDFIVFSEF